MKFEEKNLDVHFKYSGESVSVKLGALIGGTVEFLENYSSARFTDKSFAGLVGDGNGKEKFSRLLAATGLENQPETLFSLILEKIADSVGQALTINEVPLPSMMLVAILEQVIPGKGYISIENTEQLKKSANLCIPEEDESDLQEVIDKYPVRLSKHTIRQMMVSNDVAYQYMPFVEELGSVGFVNTWIGQFHEGLLEQMYQNRVIFLLHMECPVYCRFCFRKHKDSRNEANPTPEDVKKAVQHVRDSPLIKEVVVTGGDPFMSRKNMTATLDGLAEVDHVEAVRLATRAVAYYPDLFLNNDSWYLKFLKEKNYKLQQSGKRMELATHFIHPDEVSPESLDIISDLVSSGIAVYIQTPFLMDCNDKGPELVKLFGLLKSAGAELHYIYIPCSPIHGNSIYWKALSSGIEIAGYLRAHLSDRAIPRICTATPIGKLDWFNSGWAVEKVKDNDNFLWVRTPYTPEYFKSFAPLESVETMRLNNHGTLDIQYMADIGDEKYLLGERPEKTAPVNEVVSGEAVGMLVQELSSERQTARSIVNTEEAGVFRLHKTRVEIDADATDSALRYIQADDQISDVVISADEDVIDRLYDIKKIINALQAVDHVTSVRLRSMKFSSNPELFTKTVINALSDLNRLSVTNPLRIELESWFITADQILPAHGKLTKKLGNKGITVYANVPLLGGVNDSDVAIHQLAKAIRTAGIEFHHLYVAGLPIQVRWNQTRPVDSYNVVDIATMVRREGSGREIPRYIFFTPLGETDYGLSSNLVRDGEVFRLKLDCYNLDYFKALNEQFEFADDILVENSVPLVTIPGMIKTNDFAIS